MQHPLPLQSASISSRLPHLALLLGSALALPASVHAATLCVDKSGTAGCYSTISGAVAASASGDTINVHPGTYHEGVVITSSLFLVGQNSRTTIIDATGLPNGIYVNGFDNPASGFVTLNEVAVSGFTVRNANYEGILANNVSNTTIFGNIVVSNDQLASSSCSGLPAFETGETADCGGGIHLIGTVHSSVTHNIVYGNAGGILATDETTTTHDDVISNNLVEDNKGAAGITLASYPAYFAPDEPHQGTKTYAFGTYNVLVTQNLSSGNAAGVVITALVPGSRAYANHVSANRIVGNAGAGIIVRTGLETALPGARNPDASRNALVNNFIAENGKRNSSNIQRDAVAKDGQAGIFIGGGSNVIDTLVTGNVIDDEAVDISFNSASTLDMHLNDLLGRKVGVANTNPAGLVNATENYWGCTAGPGTRGCTSIIGGTAVTSFPFLTRPMDATAGHCMDPIFDLLRSVLTNHSDDDEDHGYSGFGNLGNRF